MKTCHLCPREFPTLAELVQHTDEAHQLEPDVKSENDDEEQFSLFNDLKGITSNGIIDLTDLSDAEDNGQADDQRVEENVLEADVRESRSVESSNSAEGHSEVAPETSDSVADRQSEQSEARTEEPESFNMVPSHVEDSENVVKEAIDCQNTAVGTDSERSEIKTEGDLSNTTETGLVSQSTSEELQEAPQESDKSDPASYEVIVIPDSPTPEEDVSTELLEAASPEPNSFLEESNSDEKSQKNSESPVTESCTAPESDASTPERDAQESLHSEETAKDSTILHQETQATSNETDSENHASKDLNSQGSNNEIVTRPCSVVLENCNPPIGPAPELSRSNSPSSSDTDGPVDKLDSETTEVRKSSDKAETSKNPINKNVLEKVKLSFKRSWQLKACTKHLKGSKKVPLKVRFAKKFDLKRQFTSKDSKRSEEKRTEESRSKEGSVEGQGSNKKTWKDKFRLKKKNKSKNKDRNSSEEPKTVHSEPGTETNSSEPSTAASDPTLPYSSQESLAEKSDPNVIDHNTCHYCLKKFSNITAKFNCIETHVNGTTSEMGDRISRFCEKTKASSSKASSSKAKIASALHRMPAQVGRVMSSTTTARYSPIVEKPDGREKISIDNNNAQPPSLSPVSTPPVLTFSTTFDPMFISLHMKEKTQGSTNSMEKSPRKIVSLSRSAENLTLRSLSAEVSPGDDSSTQSQGLSGTWLHSGFDPRLPSVSNQAAGQPRAQVSTTDFNSSHGSLQSPTLQNQSLVPTATSMNLQGFGPPSFPGPSLLQAQDANQLLMMGCNLVSLQTLSSAPAVQSINLSLAPNIQPIQNPSQQPGALSCRNMKSSDVVKSFQLGQTGALSDSRRQSVGHPVMTQNCQSGSTMFNSSSTTQPNVLAEVQNVPNIVLSEPTKQQSWFCPICNNLYCSKHGRNTHIKKMHLQKMKNPCTSCLEDFPDKIKRLVHIWTVHGKTNHLFCISCGFIAKKKKVPTATLR